MRRMLALAPLLLALGCAGTPATPRPTPTAQPTTSPTPTLAPTASPTAPPTPSPSPIFIPSPSPTVVPTPTPTTIVLPSASPAIGLPGPTCISGWQTLPSDDPKYVEGLQLLMNYMALSEPLDVVDNRYFVGPDPENILDPRFEHVERWYFKATLSTDPTYRGRWLVEKRTEDRLGVSAVAPFDTIGYASPDWHGFEGDGAPRAIPGLPGEWGGIDYNFVTGAGDSGFPGLPASQSGCLLGT